MLHKIGVAITLSSFGSAFGPLSPSVRMMYSLVLLKRFLVSILVATQGTSFLDLEVDDLDVTLENDQMLESFAAGAALVRPFAHMID